MGKPIPAFPLQWPAGWARKAPDQRKRATFSRNKRDLTINDAVTRVREELARMSIGDDDLVVSTNLELRMDGWPKSGQREPADPGVAVYWRDSRQEGWPTRCMAIDRYDRVADNLAAIAATLDAMRAIERHGGAEILDRAFTGFTALEHRPKPAWWTVLETPRFATRDEVEAAYRRMRANAHPDKPGGSNERFQAVQAAWDAYRAEVSHG